jgi:FkbM family methyltransferase
MLGSGKVTAMVSSLDRLGFRRPVAALATLAYRGQSFRVDSDGNWINAQHNGVIVSPTIHTKAMAAVTEEVLSNWGHTYRPKLGDVVIDVGAGVGDEALAFANMVGDNGRVIAIEAAPSTFECLSRTVALSSKANIVCISEGVSDTDGFAFIEDTQKHLSNSIGSTGEVRIETTTLDRLFDRLSIESIDLLKMNIEGAERNALRGLNKYADKVRNVAVSCHDFMAPASGGSWFRTKAEVIARLKELGFRVTMRPPVEGRPWVSDYVYGSR